MEHLLGECPICKKNLHQNDDVVTCPHCGAPYHRECYQKQGHCSFEGRHASGFEYKAPHAAKAQPTGAGAKTGTGVLCTACNTANDATNVFCENCGSPLHTAQQARAQNPFSYASATQGGAGQSTVPPIDLNGDIDGIAKKDWQSYIGQSAPIYLMRLNQLKQTGRKVSFIASAFIFTPIYFAYRKMWGWAAFALAITLVLLVPQIVFSAAQDGIMLIPALDVETLSIVDTITFYFDTFIRLLFALYAMNIYRKNAAKHILVIRKNESDEEEVQSALVRKGGVSILGVVGVFALMAVFYWLAYRLVGDSIFNLLYYLPIY